MRQRLDGGQQLVFATLLAILVITAGWWALALWPVADGAPDWLLRTRYVCFGNRVNELPNAGGWLLLVGQPLSMVGFLLLVWGGTVRSAVRRVAVTSSGRVQLWMVPLLFVGGLGLVTVRAVQASVAAAAPREDAALAAWPVNRALPAVALVDQHGDTLVWDRFRGRSLVLTFAYAHCDTICPLAVKDALTVRQLLAGRGEDAAVGVITLDPWRDTPSRLPAIAAQWALGPDDVVLGGAVASVLDALAAFDVFATRDDATGDVTHPALLYLIDERGRIRRASHGGAAGIRALTGAPPD